MLCRWRRWIQVGWQWNHKVVLKLGQAAADRHFPVTRQSTSIPQEGVVLLHRKIDNRSLLLQTPEMSRRNRLNYEDSCGTMD